MTPRALWAALLAAAIGSAGCDTDFEDPSIVIDLRVLGMRAEPPEVVVPYDPDDPTQVDIDDLGTVRVCALVADPTEQRGLGFEMILCTPSGNGRCEGDAVAASIGSGAVEDPDGADVPVEICSTVEATADLVAVIEKSVRVDDLAGFGGVGVQIEVTITPEGGSAADVVHGFKRVRYSPALPAGRVANANPTLEGITGIREATGERGLDFEVPLGRCGAVQPILVAPGERVTFLPREPPGAREEYLVPTFEGGSRRFVENLAYQWLATAGDWSRLNSGGELDPVGNQPPLDSRWTAPDEPEEVGDGLDVPMWIVQRDERGGQTWFESCARVVP